MDLRKVIIAHLAYQILPYTRALDQEHLLNLVQSIKDQSERGLGSNGLLYPIHVWEYPDPENRRVMKQVVLQGRSRTEAYRLLGRDRIDAFVHTGKTYAEAQMIAIDTTLIRQPTDVIERGELWIARAIVILATQIKEKASPKASPNPSTSIFKAAEAENVSYSASVKARRIAGFLTPAAKRAARDCGLGNSTRTLLAVADANPEEGRAYAKLNQMLLADPADEVRASIEQKLHNIEKPLEQQQLSILENIKQQRAAGANISTITAPTSLGQSPRPVGRPPSRAKPEVFVPMPFELEEWRELEGGSLFCGSPNHPEFKHHAPNAVLAIAPILNYSPDRGVWDLDWLSGVADIVVVPVCYQADIPFAQSCRMPWRTTLQAWIWSGKRLEMALNLVVFSESPGAVDERVTEAVQVSSWDQLAEYILAVFSRNGDQIISAGLDPSGAILRAASKGKRIFWACDESPEICGTAMGGWESAERKPEPTQLSERTHASVG